MKQFKIAFAGTHCTGKTSTVNEISRMLHECGVRHNLLSEAYRETASIFGLGGLTKKHNRNAVLHTYALQMLREIECLKNSWSILCDRTVIDSFIYYDLANNNKRINYPEYNMLRNAAKEHLKTYDRIYLICPTEDDIIDDGFRNKDKCIQYAAHDLFLEHMEHLDSVLVIDRDEIVCIIPTIIQCIVSEWLFS